MSVSVGHMLSQQDSCCRLINIHRASQPVSSATLPALNAFRRPAALFVFFDGIQDMKSPLNVPARPLTKVTLFSSLLSLSILPPSAVKHGGTT